jgi:hypothetical protein
VITGKRKGMTRQEAFAQLDIDKIELLDTGEIKLPNGKIIGHRQYRHIYKQKLRMPDEREQVVINKLAIEYRRIQKELQGGPKHNGAVMVYTGPHPVQVSPAQSRAQKKQEDRMKREAIRAGMQNNKTMMWNFVDRANNTI